MTDRASTERLLAADPTEEWVADEWAHRSSESDRASAEGLRVLQQIRDAANGTDLSDPTISAIFDIASAALRDEDIMEAWGIIANVGGGDWTTQTQEWQDAAARWRDRVIAQLSARLSTPRTETSETADTIRIGSKTYLAGSDDD
jgi:hypothetical protein